MPRRRAGLLLHVSSLPGPFGIGDLGPAAHGFLAWAASAGQSVWQILPAGPTGRSDSPYDGQSAFAGNPLLISPQRLLEENLLPPGALDPRPAFPDDRTLYELLVPWKSGLLALSWRRFRERAPGGLREEFEAFVAAPLQSAWLEDWALYSALKRRARGAAWTRWSEPLRRREPEALATARRELAGEMEFHRFVQFLFFRQWKALRDRAARLGVEIMGDVPIYVAPDSADVWANARLFQVDADGRPLKLAGVPPDYFSAEGQLWGNPLYDWPRMEQEGFAWWVERMRSNFRLADVVRMDHFRGFVSCWEVPAGSETAAAGRWAPGPGARLFEAIRAALGEVKIVAEDLGLITPDVEALRRGLGLPGMKVLQFGAADPSSDHHPSRIEEDSVAYTGTHDNDTIRGWFERLDETDRRRVREGIGAGAGGVSWAMIRAACGSRARLAISPLQDVLDLGSEARMNTPGRAEGNWRWRVRQEALTPELAARLRELSRETGRAG